MKLQHCFLVTLLVSASLLQAQESVLHLVTSNKYYLQKQISCVLDQAPCNVIGRAIKSKYKQFLSTNCIMYCIYNTYIKHYLIPFKKTKLTFTCPFRASTCKKINTLHDVPLQTLQLLYTKLFRATHTLEVIIELLPEALNNNCRRCTPQQMEYAETLMAFMQQNHPNELRSIIQYYTPMKYRNY
ncbi:uncharacterized protein LOC143217552 [Lasioglossum baleicum]|uniref:uncharacterized protein LOC143217552 n=1 Tax=Lasioglossum baleicum TaxID=434251 RepID=UPI003FCE9D33